SSEVIGRSVYDRLPRPVAEQALAAARRALDEGGVQTHEYSLEVRGVERQYEARVVASAADEVVSIVREITDRKEQEHEVRWPRAPRYLSRSPPCRTSGCPMRWRRRRTTSSRKG